jgi:hypothetical protein
MHHCEARLRPLAHPEIHFAPVDLVRPFDAEKMTTWRVDAKVGKREERYIRLDRSGFEDHGGSVRLLL